MCGIAGYTGRWSEADCQDVGRRLHHRGPDGHGAYIDDSISISNNRLSLIDLEGGSQPIFNEDRSAAIVFNGEIYNYRELRADLESRHRFRTASDTEVILHLFEERGHDVSRHLRGDFAFCIWDFSTRTCFLSRDPLGVKPLYYAQSPDGGLVFNSELAALVETARIDPALDLEAIAEYFTFLYIPAPRTLYRDVKKLCPGESLVWDGGSIRTWKYWTLPPVDPPSSGDDLLESVREGLDRAVARRLIADVPVGAFLSGGIDSSLVVAIASEHQKGLHTFSAGFGDPDFDELEPAREVARRFGTTHHEFEIRPQAEVLLEEVIAAMDEPIADSSAIPTYLISRETSHHVKAALSGVGGDELFFGYPRYLGLRLSEKVPRGLRGIVSRASPLFRSVPRGRDVGGWIRRFTEGLPMAPSDRYHYWTTYLDRDRARRLLEFGSAVEPFPLETMAPGSGDLLDAASRLDLSRYLGSGLLKFGDGMSMAHSLELRVPFCDVDLVESVSRIGSARRFPGYRLKGMLKNVARGYLPESIVNRPKQGFMIPVGRWFRNELRSYVTSELDPGHLPPLLRATGVADLLDEHLRGRANHTHLVWATLVLVRWLRMHPECHTGLQTGPVS